MATTSQDRVELPAHSMFQHTPIYNDGSVLILPLRRVVIAPDATDQLFEITIELEGRLDLIAHSQLGSAELWWLICDLNFMKDPMLDAAAGTLIRVPTLSRVQKLLEGGQ